jgi:hypothetical protein
VVRPSEEEDVGFFDSSVFEAAKKRGDDYLKAFLRDALTNTSVTCVLAGTNTLSRRWVRYEIARSIVKGNAVLTVDIDGVANERKQRAAKGPNPLNYLGLYRTATGIFFAEWKQGKWLKYRDYQRSISEDALWFDAPTTARPVPLSSYCLRYDFSAQNGRTNIGGWIETAAGLAGR